MRIVDCLTKMTECPNCGSKKLYGVYFSNTHKTGGVCGDCGETFEERCNSSSAVLNEEKEREELLMDARDLLHDLPLFARTANELDTLTQITNIFDKILTLLEKE